MCGMEGNIIDVSGLSIILILAIIIFVPSKFPPSGRDVGETLREFKSSTNKIADDVEEDFKIEGTKEKKEKITKLKVLSISLVN